MFDPARPQIQEIILLILDSDHSQDLFPDLDLELSISQLNVIIVTTWVTQQIIASDVRIKNIQLRQPNQGKRNNYRNFKRYPSYRPDSRYTTPNTPQHRVNFSEPPMYSDLQIGNQQ